MCPDGSLGSIPRCFLLCILLLGTAHRSVPAQQRRGPGQGDVSHTLQSLGALGYAADWFNPVEGGLSRKSVGLGNLDALLHLNLDALPGMWRTQLRVHIQGNHGGSISSRVGDLQGVSNLEAESELRLYEAWIQRQVLLPGLSILAGVYDVNSEFDVLPAAADLLNGSFGFGAAYSCSGPNGPSTFPATGLAARVRTQITPVLYALLSVSDAVPGGEGESQFALNSSDGALVSFEVGYARGVLDLPSSSRGLVRGQRRGWERGAGRHRFGGQRRMAGRGRFLEEVKTKVALGGWAYSQPQPKFVAGEPQGRSWGVYVLGEQMLSRRPDGTGGISAFARLGAAEEETNRLGLSAGGGLLWRGPLQGRPDDLLALGVAHARHGSSFLQAQREAGRLLEEAETVMELTYKARLGDYFFLQPDLQWIRNPGMNPTLSQALVLGIRGQLLLEMPMTGSAP